MRRFSLLFFIFPLFVNAQVGLTSAITGQISDAVTGSPIELVTIYVSGTSRAVESSASGRYQIQVPSEESFSLVFSRIGYKEVVVKIASMPAGTNKQVDIALAASDMDIEVVVKQSKLQQGGMIREDVSQLKLLPSTTGNFESLLPHIALGASGGTGGELSSQYNVRGGNFDENLVYINDFEIYRPQLIRAGQQEGLTFPNIDLIRDLSFSSGGFEARFGDKMSSVLDIKYKRPDSVAASFSASFLGGSAHLEGSKPIGTGGYKKFRYLLGARYKTTRYLLGSLDVKGEYVPNFADIQTYLTYDLSSTLQLGFLGNYNRSVYRFTPTERTTALGLISLALQLSTLFEGNEVDDFTTSMGGVSLTWLPDRKRNPIFLKFMGSVFTSDENERFDIIGDYSLRQIETGLGSSSFGKVIAELGSGTQHQYVRNMLDARVWSFQHRGGYELDNRHFFNWGFNLQYESIIDRIREWERIDSALYSLPFDPDQVLLYNVLRTTNQLISQRYSFYFQDAIDFTRSDLAEFRITAGVRGSYWNLNREFLISPRIQMMFKPLIGSRDITYRLAGGLYHQTPFYRELRGIDGVANRDLKAQKSVHLVGGFTLDFYSGKTNPKKFKFITEAFYKYMWDLVSYDVENVRISYSGQNDARGYAAGLDLRINGEFVPGADSWINLSFLTTREKLYGVQHLIRERGQQEGQPVNDVPRPTDRLFNLSMFFQDYLPRNENFKMHLNFTVGSGLPFGLKDNNVVFRNTYRFNPYHRVDIGFSYLFKESAWFSLEVFNLMQVQNQAGNTWIKTVFQQQYAIPNYLTSRRINLRLRVDF
jgi:hypothetical protein